MSITRRSTPAVVAVTVVAAFILALVGLIPAGPVSPAAADPPPGALPSTGLVVADGSFSANAAVLLDGVEGADPADAWANSANPWSDASYPMEAIVDLGELHDIAAVHYHAGQIPFPSTAALQVDASPDGIVYVPVATGTSPDYDAWSAPLDTSGTQARYVRLRFAAATARFDITELAVTATPVDTGGGGGSGGGGSGGGGELSGITAIDEANSTNAARLVDTMIGPGTDQAWENPNPWDPANFAMSAILDLGDTHTLTELRYHVGNIVDPSQDQVRWQFSTEAAGDGWQPLHTSTDHAWNDWYSTPLGDVEARRLRVRFTSVTEMVNLSEVIVVADGDTPPPPPPPPPPPGGDLPDPHAEGALQPAPPDQAVRAGAFGHTHGHHLSDACKALHDRYWTLGPDGQAYRTWHPAITYIPETGEVCDFGHEHGFMPTKAGADAFDLMGGWPPFGYAAEQAGYTQLHSHESHEGHKVTVANFRAAIGNAANKGSTIYDAGFDCTWLSKIHQGSFSLDALANNAHEYFLAVTCDDGTEFSVKFIYTLGNPNEFNAVGCGGLVPSGPVIGFDGNPQPPANRPGPGPNEEANGREFVCAPGVIWNELANLQDVTLWTQPNWVERGGQGVLMLQPYYSVIDMPWLLTGPTSVARTLDLCYGADDKRIYPDGLSPTPRFCEFGPYDKPTDDWEDAASPFNGTRRAVNFKTLWLTNAGGVERWCTDAFGRSTPGADSALPCGPGQIEQYAATIDNGWNDGSICHNGVCNITGSIRATDPWGRTFAAPSNGNGGFVAPGPAKEFPIDQSEPDDNFDGQPDGANIRGRN